MEMGGILSQGHNATIKGAAPFVVSGLLPSEFLVQKALVS